MSNIYLYDLGDDAGLPADRLLYRRAGHHPAVAGADLGPRGRPAGVRVLRGPEVRRLHHHQPARPQARSPTSSRPSTASASWRAWPRRRSTPPARSRCARRCGPRSVRAARSTGRQQGFRSSSDLARTGDTVQLAQPVSISALLDSANYSLPDTSEFTLKDYRVHFSPDYIARPSIGYARDNFGRGFFGGSAISLSDMLGNHQLVFAGYVNGRISEAQVLAAYANLSQRINWAVGRRARIPTTSSSRARSRSTRQTGDNIFITNIRRLVVRSVFGQAYYPLSRFQRIESSAAVRQRGRRAAPDQRALRPQHRVRHRRSVPGDRQSAGRELPPAVDGAGVRQLAVRVRRPVLRAALSLRVRPDARRLAVLPGDGRLSPLRPDRRADRAGHPGALLRPDRP